MKEDEDRYKAVVENIRLMALMDSLYFDEIQAIKTHVVKLNIYYFHT